MPAEHPKPNSPARLSFLSRLHQRKGNTLLVDDGKARYSDPSRSVFAGKQGGTAKFLFVPVMERFCYLSIKWRKK
jgi:hypothetical protein